MQDYYVEPPAESTNNTTAAATLNPLVTFGLRKQIEAEVYVPLRSILSKAIVNGWRPEDIQVSASSRLLRDRSYDFFKIPEENRREGDWIEARKILRNGTRKTLPCDKLRAIVECAREINRNHEETVDNNNKPNSSLSADELVPIFIFVVVNADIERPCSLSALLQNVCNSEAKIGELGYYLSTFEAAVNYISILAAEEEEKTKDIEEKTQNENVGLEFESDPTSGHDASLNKVTNDMQNVLSEAGFLS